MSTYRVGCPEWVLMLDVDGNARVLAARLWHFVDGEEARRACAGEGPDPFVWPSRSRLATELRCTDRAIRRQITALEECGTIRRERREVGGAVLDGFVLAARQPDASVRDTGRERPDVSDRTEESGRRSPDAAVRQAGRCRPPSRTLRSAKPDASVRHITPGSHQDHTEDHSTPQPPKGGVGEVRCSECNGKVFAMADSWPGTCPGCGSPGGADGYGLEFLGGPGPSPAEPAPLRLVPEEPTVDPIEVAVDEAVRAFADGREALGQPRPRAPRASRRKALAKLAKREPGLIPAVCRRVLEAARREGEQKGIAAADTWLGQHYDWSYLTSERAIERYGDKADLDVRKPQQRGGPRMPAKRRAFAPFNLEDRNA